ncbi:MAG: hypothetical protein K6U11_06655 [bacterium]|nr:hypothetical protein [bacterium]
MVNSSPYWRGASLLAAAERSPLAAEWRFWRKLSQQMDSAFPLAAA